MSVNLRIYYSSYPIALSSTRIIKAAVLTMTDENSLPFIVLFVYHKLQFSVAIRTPVVAMH